MTLKQAIKKLGGPSAAARAIGVRRTTLVYWTQRKPPFWRTHDIQRLIAIAEMVEDGAVVKPRGIKGGA